MLIWENDELLGRYEHKSNKGTTQFVELYLQGGTVWERYGVNGFPTTNRERDLGAMDQEVLRDHIVATILDNDYIKVTGIKDMIQNHKPKQFSLTDWVGTK